jgi:hypothetical protein
MNSWSKTWRAHARPKATRSIERALRSLLAVLMCAAPPEILAQVAGGTITGTARGETGSAIPGVQISIKDVATGQVRTALTDTSFSLISALRVGLLTLTSHKLWY